MATPQIHKSNGLIKETVIEIATSPKNLPSYVKKAKELGLAGWIRNEADGKVGLVIEGDDDALKVFVDWAWEGSPMSDVADVVVKEGEATGEFESFKII